eukprot:TRINITY_DN16608_c0_g1_i1.p1 TRINITY_DN16608_c0_g1~~TRINITY_DN16608_c0_g1_i1.p1  ORF type:complete len:368 (+),score=81.43 TRINITY_DN16608_c0_g1_i1:306-1409(+)
MMNDHGVVHMVEPLHCSFVREHTPGVMINGGNTCYMSAVVFAMFARMDTWDILLVHQLAWPLAGRLQDHLRDCVVNPLRRSETVAYHIMRELRELCRYVGWEADLDHRLDHQQDASEFSVFLLDVLEAPLLPAVENVFHGGKDDEGDSRCQMERLIAVALPEAAPKKTGMKRLFSSNVERPLSLERMLWNHFFENQVHLQRRIDGEQSPVELQGLMMQKLNAWFEGGSRGVAGLVLPIALKRFEYVNGQAVRVNRAVEIPELIDFSDFVNTADASRATFKLRLRSLVCHVGSRMQEGHYTCFTSPLPMRRRGEESQRWLYFDDVGRPALQPCKHPGEVQGIDLQRDAYLLFYAVSYTHLTLPTKRIV